MPSSTTSPADEKRISKPTRASRVASELRTAILRGEIEAGAKVNLDQLRSRFGISLSPLREAISRLVADGLVEAEDQRGFRIAPMSGENLAEVTGMRADLEGLALGLSIDRADVEWEGGVLSALHRLNRIDRDPDRPESIEAWESAHADFHNALAAGCGRPMLRAICVRLHGLNDRYRRLLIRQGGGDRDVASEHAAIADAAVGRNRDLAIALLRQHIQRTGTALAGRIAGLLPVDTTVPRKAGTGTGPGNRSRENAT